MSTDDDPEARWTTVHLAGSEVTVCLWCGCLVILGEGLHAGRCYGEVRRREDDEFALAMFEERVEAGEYDDEP